MGCFQGGRLANFHRCPRIHSGELYALYRRWHIPNRPNRPHALHRRTIGAAARRRTHQRRPRRSGRPPVYDYSARCRLHRLREGTHRRPANGRAFEKGDHAQWWPAHGRDRSRSLRLQNRWGRTQNLERLPQEPQYGGLRCLLARYPSRAQIGHRYRAAGRLWPGPDHRRLSPRCALRRGLLAPREAT